jgi:uncharacterized protein YjbI with pentapeptide repeats
MSEQKHNLPTPTRRVIKLRREPKTSADVITAPQQQNNNYWRIVGQPWRTEPEINAKRQAYLKDCLTTIAPDIEHGIYPFKDVKLDRADVEWLLATYEEKTWQTGTNLTIRTGLDLRGADLRRIDLQRLPLAGLIGGIEGEEWFKVTEEQREAAAVHLEGANLTLADLSQAQLKSAHFEGADLSKAHFEFASLRGAHLGGKSITETCKGQHLVSEYIVTKLPAAHLQYTFFNLGSTLEDTDLGNEQDGYVRLVDVRWGGVNLAPVNWSQVKMLGNEQEARQRKTTEGKTKDKTIRLKEYEVAVRANRQLAIALQEQGLNEDAARFAYRAQRLQRVVLRRQHKFGSYFFSGFLDLIAGYGYRPGRSLFAYLIIIFGFMGLYLLNAHFVSPHLTWDEALVLSVSCFHGRGFFAQDITLGTTYARLAAAEAIVGLLIEISFIATFTQRFFGK